MAPTFHKLIKIVLMNGGPSIRMPAAELNARHCQRGDKTHATIFKDVKEI